MMDGVKQYLLTVVIGALLCAIFSKVCNKSSTSGMLVKLLAEIFMLLLIISPLLRIDIVNVYDYFSNSSFTGTDYIAQGQLYTKEQTDKIISDSVCSYILDKAAELDSDIDVDIVLSETSPSIPVGVVIYGDVSPYTKTVMQKFIADDLGIPEESQVWN